MVNVTTAIKNYKQPRGGWINPKQFNVVDLSDGKTLAEKENIHSSIMGITVDYMSRVMNGTPAKDAFRVSIKGASIIKQDKLAERLLEDIKGLDYNSLVSAFQLAGFDTVVRAGAPTYRPIDVADEDTVENLKVMVERSITFFEEYGPVTKDGFTFMGGYTNKITSGDGDFLTEDTIWDFKTTKNPPTNKHTLQLLVYYLMGTRSIHFEFDDIENLGIFNARLNKVYTLPISDIPTEVLNEVSTNLIGHE